MNDESIDHARDNDHKGRRRSVIPLVLAAAAAVAPLSVAVDAGSAPSITDQFASAFVPGKVDVAVADPTKQFVVENSQAIVDSGMAIVE